MVRFVHTADWQLGMTRHYLSDDAQARFTQSRFDAIRKTAGLATREHARFVVVAGDVFESNQLDPRTVERALDAMRAFRVPVYLLPGNHDALDPGSVYKSRAFQNHKPDHLHVFTDANPIEVEPGIEVVGAPWTSRRPLVDLVHTGFGSLEPKPGVLRIGVGHGSLDAMNPDRTNPALIRLQAAEQIIREHRIHYLALGDHHSSHSEGSTGRIRYSGAPEPTDYDEQKPGHALLVDLTADSCNVQEHPIATWRFIDHAIELVTDHDLERLDTFLQENPRKETTILRLAVKGTLSLGGRARFEEILEHHRNLYGAIDLWERNTQLSTMPDQADLDNLQLEGFARAALDDLRTKAGPPANDASAQDALALLYRLAAGGPR